MPGYLDQYGAGEERRNRIIIRSILAALIVAFVWTLGWYLLMNHHQESVVKSFVAALKRGDTKSAYAIWGCTAARPCNGYEYQQVPEGLGPRTWTDQISKVLGLTDSEACNDAVMITVRVNPTRIEQLWLDRTSDMISFAPFPICPAQIPYEIMAHRTVGKLRKIFLQ